MLVASRSSLIMPTAHVDQLNKLVSGGTSRARKVKRAQLLLTSAHGVADAVIATTVRCGTSTVYRIKKRLVEQGLDAALEDRARPGQRKLTGRDEALLVALACSKLPTGRAHWTMKLLADEF